EKFLSRKAELFRRVDNIISGFGSIGINAMPLDTQGIIELYYNSYNPATSANQQMPNVNEIRTS
ncbi:MAG: hypothetical protein U9R06_03055, partial [Patescibacteria group bacterium]|nr:hypothetical protein [Patescibacteria group bacterium]